MGLFSRTVKKLSFKYRKAEKRLLPVIVAALTSVILIYAITAVKHTGIIDNLELSMLDARMAIRSLRFEPSSDIVIVSSDAYTEQTAQRFPQLGMTSRMLPRAQLASLIEYLNRQGARAVVLDVELRQEKDGDDDLLAAIRDAGNVYAAVQFDNALDRFITEQNQGRRERWPYHLAMQPFINRFSQSHIDWFKKPLLNPYLAGLVSYEGYALSGFSPQSMTAFLNKYSGNYWFNQSVWPNSIVRRQIELPADNADLEKSLYTPHCVQGQYHRLYGNKPGYLKALRQHILKGEILRQWSSFADRKNSYCYVSPVSLKVASTLKGLGVSSVSYQQGFIRSVPVLYRGYLGAYYTYLGLRPVLDLMGEDNHFVYHPDFFKIGSKRFPVEEENQLYINWRNPSLLLKKMSGVTRHDLSREIKKASAADNNPVLGGGHMYRLVSAGSILRVINNLPPDINEQGAWPLYKIPGQPQTGEFDFKDKIIVYGDTLKDIHRTPVGDTTFGPEIVAAALDSALNDKQYIESGPEWVTILITFVLSLIVFVAAGMVFESYLLGFVFALAVLAVYWFFNLIAFNGALGGIEFPKAYWFPIVEPSLYITLVVGFSMLYRNYTDSQETEQLTKAFSNYVSPQIMDEIVKNPSEALEKLSGEKKELSVLFSDLKGFTAQFETVDPETMVYQLNEYLDVMTNIILEHGGTYDKYMGDAIMAFFGAPVDLPNHASQACQAAFHMQRALKDLNERWKLQGLEPLAQGIGVSSGEMFVGNLGSKNIKNFTVMGTHVNLGSRLESLTRAAGVPIIISERTVQIAGNDILVKSLGKAKVKGFREPVPVYSLVSIRKH